MPRVKPDLVLKALVTGQGVGEGRTGGYQLGLWTSELGELEPALFREGWADAYFHTVY